MKVERPWGWYEVIDEGDRYKTKNIEVNPERDYRYSIIIIAQNIGWW